MPTASDNQSNVPVYVLAIQEIIRSMTRSALVLGITGGIFALAFKLGDGDLRTSVVASICTCIGIAFGYYFRGKTGEK